MAPTTSSGSSATLRKPILRSNLIASRSSLSSSPSPMKDHRLGLCLLGFMLLIPVESVYLRCDDHCRLLSQGRIADEKNRQIFTRACIEWRCKGVSKRSGVQTRSFGSQAKLGSFLDSPYSMFEPIGEQKKKSWDKPESWGLGPTEMDF